ISIFSSLTGFSPSKGFFLHFTLFYIMKMSLIFFMSALCAGGLCGVVRAANSPLIPTLPELNSEAFRQKCVLIPLKYQDRYWGWQTDEAMQAFCKWFNLETHFTSL
ncbi:MAG: hypothetical protein RSA21_07265, partial [Akkermansia sp.]